MGLLQAEADEVVRFWLSLGAPVGLFRAGSRSTIRLQVCGEPFQHLDTGTNMRPTGFCCGLVGGVEEASEEVGVDPVAQFAGEGVEVAGRGRGGGSHCW